MTDEQRAQPATDEKRAQPAECALCEEYSKTGGPSHTPSSRCQSGKHPHCTCDRCF